jgi:hypothetical protein
MKPLFTVHAGEYVVGSYIEKHFKRVHVWVPSRDTGVDLLVSDSRNRRAVSLQVKFSKDFLYTRGPEFQKHLRFCGWWTVNQKKLRTSRADLWVFVAYGLAGRPPDFVIIPPRVLWARLRSVHGSQKTFQSYLWVTKANDCWEARGLKMDDQLRITRGTFRARRRDFSRWLNKWAPLAALNQ